MLVLSFDVWWGFDFWTLESDLGLDSGLFLVLLVSSWDLTSELFSDLLVLTWLHSGLYCLDLELECFGLDGFVGFDSGLVWLQVWLDQGPGSLGSSYLELVGLISGLDGSDSGLFLWLNLGTCLDLAHQDLRFTCNLFFLFFNVNRQLNYVTVFI